MSIRVVKSLSFVGAMLSLAAPGLAAAQNNSDGLEEVVVTAQKREERLIDVPISITSIDAEKFAEQQLVQISDYYSRIPGLQYQGDTTVSLSLRGITTGNATNPTLAILIDDVPFGASSQLALGNGRFPDFDPSMLERFEVLRGPQGTLYGASSMGGVLKYVTRRPDTQNWGARLEGGLNATGGDDGFSGRGSLNWPIVQDHLALRVSVFKREDPGYINDVLAGFAGKDVNTVEAEGGHASLLFQANDNFSVTLSALRQERLGLYSTGIIVNEISGTPNFASPMFCQDCISLRPASDDTTQELYTARIEWGITENLKLTSISAWGKSQSSEAQDLTNIFGGLFRGVFGAANVSAVTIDDRANNERFTQELRLGSQNERLEWRVGLFYSDEDGAVAQRLNQIDASGASTNRYDATGPISVEEKALFGDLVFHVNDKFDVQVGARYAENEQGRFSASTIDPMLAGVFGPSSVSPVFPADDKPFTWAISPSYHFNPDLLGYFRAASGYRQGGPNTNVAGLPPTFDSDSVLNFEFGFKGYFKDNRNILWDLALYQINWSDIQLQNTNSATQFTYFTNGSKARSRGLELATQVRLENAWTIDANVTFGKAELSSALPILAMGIDGLQGISGSDLPGSSEFTGNFSVQKKISWGNNLSSTLGFNWGYVGERNSQLLNTSAIKPRFTLPAYSVLDLNADLNIGEHWKVVLFARNALNEEGVVTAQNRNGTNTPTTVNFLRPRTFGFSVAWEL